MKTFIFILYRLLLWTALPLVALYLSVRRLRQSGYGLRERLGGAPQGHKRATPPNGIWLHAVSVGEVLSAVRLIRELKQALPGVAISVSVGTVAGRQVAEARLSDLADSIFYAPVDYVWCVRRTLRRIRPALLIVMETEIWPNLWNEAAKTGAAVLVINGRLSDRAWPRYWRLRAIFGPVLRIADSIFAQDETSRERYAALGATEARFAGNLKYDLGAPTAPPPDVATWIQSAAPSRVWIAASTMPPAAPGDPDEDDAVIQAFLALTAAHPRLLMILVPRKPERFDEAAQKLAAAGIPFARRSRLEPIALPGALLLDSMGELASLFPLADAVFMGGTLASRGGHNILEPAFAAKPVVVGPHMENFAEVLRDFRADQAVVEIASASQLGHAVAELLSGAGHAIGTRGREVAERGQGATARSVAEATRLFAGRFPRIASPWPLNALAGLWGAGSAANRRRWNGNQKRLPRPVISIGGIAAGGTGKTPLVLWLAAELQSRGVDVAFLTRGYRRQSSGTIVAAPGESVAAAQTGDEAQLLIRSALGSVGIAADRHSAGLLLIERQPSVKAFLLDDGMQHHRLARDLEIVAIDALDPFAGGRLLPAGRLREPVHELRRASAFVITRSKPGGDTSLEAALRQLNPTAPIFRPRNRNLGWRDLEGNPVQPLGNALAFCGLGNPNSFWQSVAEATGLHPLAWRAFPDHHPYTSADIEALFSEANRLGAVVLLTTEKDAMNLPPGLAPRLPIYWMKLALEVENGDQLADLVMQTISSAP